MGKQLTPELFAAASLLLLLLLVSTALAVVVVAAAVGVVVVVAADDESGLLQDVSCGGVEVAESVGADVDSAIPSEQAREREKKKNGLFG